MIQSKIIKTTQLSASAKYAPISTGGVYVPARTYEYCSDIQQLVFPNPNGYYRFCPDFSTSSYGACTLYPIPPLTYETTLICSVVTEPAHYAYPPVPPASPPTIYLDANLGWNAGARTVSEFDGEFVYSFSFGTGTISTYVGLNAGIDSSTLPTETPITIRNDRGVATLTYPGGLINLGFVTNNQDTNYFTFTRDANNFISLRYLKDGVMVDAETAPMTPWTYKYNGIIHLETSIYTGRDYVFLAEEYGIKKASATLSSIASLYLDQTKANARLRSKATVISGAGIGGIYKYLRAKLNSSASIEANIYSDARLSSAIHATASVSAKLAEGANITLPSLKCFASDRPLAVGYTTLPSLRSTIVESLPRPSVSISISSFAYLIGTGVGITGGILSGDSTLPALKAGASADHPYAFSEAFLPSLSSYGAWVDPIGEASYIDIAPIALNPSYSSTITVAASSSFTLDGGISAFKEFYDTILTKINTQVTPAVVLITEGSAVSSISVYISEATDIGSDWNSWVVNYETNAHWRYDNFQYNSFCKFNGKTYGCKEDGVYELSGDTDAGTNIESKVTTSVTDFDNALKKRMLKAYLGIKSDGDMVLKVLAEGGNVYYYGIDNTRSSVGGTRVNIGRGLTSRYWQFELLNSNGSDFELDAIEFFPVITSRREM